MRSQGERNVNEFKLVLRLKPEHIGRRIFWKSGVDTSYETSRYAGTLREMDEVKGNGSGITIEKDGRFIESSNAPGDSGSGWWVELTPKADVLRAKIDAIPLQAEGKAAVAALVEEITGVKIVDPLLDLHIGDYVGINGNIYVVFGCVGVYALVNIQTGLSRFSPKESIEALCAELRRESSYTRLKGFPQFKLS
jgi:hypothetical protein